MILNNLQEWQWYGVINRRVSFKNFFINLSGLSWPTDETSGDVLLASNPAIPAQSILASSAYPGTELYVGANAASDNSGNEANATTDWVAGGATLTSDATIKSTGNYSLKYVATASGGRIYFDLDTILTVGKRYSLSVDARHIGVGSTNTIALAPSTSGIDNTIASIEVTDTTFVKYSYHFTHSANTRYLVARETNTSDNGGLYLDNVSVKPANPLNADVTGAAITPTSGVSFPYARTYNGTTTYTDIYSTELNSALDPTDFSFGIFVQKGTWDTTERDFFSLDVDANNYIRCTDTTTAGTIQFDFMAGGTLESISYVTGSPTGWFYVDLTVTGGNLIASFNGAVVGTPQSVAGTFTGNLASAVIGARTTAPANVHLGDLSVPYMGMLRSFTQSEKLTIAQKAGVV